MPASSATLDPPPVPASPGAEVAADRPLLRGWLHLVMLPLALAGGAALAAGATSAGARAALVVYTLGMSALFGVSAAFHRIRWSPAARRRMRRADHSTIFVGIAGTYTAVAVLALHGWAEVLVLCLVWIGGACGIAFRQIWLDAPKWAIALPYLVVGWCALAVVPQLVRGMGGAGFGLLVAGGAAYTFGALAYARRKPDPRPRVFGYHEVFHACTVLGAALHFAAIATYALHAR
ncbi:MAG TPA: hemolysin III family protein [Acidimicrobiales bacterium]|nr:hemolysin III family protein [Acidimicrobiales bacterium]